MASLEAELLYCAMVSDFSWTPSIPVLGAWPPPRPHSRGVDASQQLQVPRPKGECKTCLSLGGHSILLENIAQSSRPCNLDHSPFPIPHGIFKSREVARDRKNLDSALLSKYLMCSCLGTELVDTWVCIATGPSLTGHTTGKVWLQLPVGQ